MAESNVAQRAKEAGSNAWSRGDYPEAITQFSVAIDNASKDKEMLKILYSNRSAAYLKVGQTDKALADANKCVELDAQWAKGYTRKGDALYSLRRYTEAYNAYNGGVRLSPGDSALQEKADKAMRAIAGEGDRQSSSSSSSSNASSRFGSGFGSSSPASTPSLADGYPINYYLKVGVLVLVLAYLIPLGHRINFMDYRLCALAFTADLVLCMVKKHGFPRWSQDYAALVLTDPSMSLVLLGVFVVFSVRPYLLCLGTILLNVAPAFTPIVFQYARDNARTLEDKIYPMMARFVPALANVRIEQLFNPAIIPQVNVQLLKLAASAELSQGIFHIIELLLPSRNILQLYLWWQYLRLRYMQDRAGYIKQAFAEMHQRINQLLQHQYCPAIVRRGYQMLATYMAKQVEIPTGTQQQQQAGGGGGIGSMLSRCTIM